nr:reverse transcriptase domain-containing protein [Tanacetum cinerariifolium]
ESSPNLTSSNPNLRNCKRSKKPFILEESPIDTIADQHTMAELLRAPIEGYAEVIVVPPILVDHFELKHSLINMMTSDQFFGLEKDNPHDHIHRFNKITSTIKYKDVPNSAIKRLLFPFSFAGAARRWLEKEPRHSILIWEDLVSKFINELFPPSRTTNLQNEISNFQQRFDESFHKAWDRYKDLLGACPHHERHAQDVLMIIENKSKCLPADGNTFLEFRDNIQGYVSAAAINYNQGNSGYRPPTVILKKLPEKLGDPGKFLISCGFSELKCKALADIGASINLMPLSVWKTLGLPELISTRKTLELANRAICTPARIVRDVFVLVGKFTFSTDFFIVDCESNPRVPLILGRPFLRTARSLIDVHGEEMILYDEVINPLSGNTTSSSPNYFLEEFTDELALITFPPRNDDLPCDIESDLREIEYLLNHDPTKEMDSILEDSVDEGNLTDLNNDLVDTIPEMFTDEHTIDYSSPPLYDDVDDDLAELESNNDDVYDDPFDSKKDNIKESKLFIDELDPPRSSDSFLPLSMTRFSIRIFPRLMLCLQPIMRTKYLIWVYSFMRTFLKLLFE